MDFIGVDYGSSTPGNAISILSTDTRTTSEWITESTFADKMVSPMVLMATTVATPMMIVTRMIGGSCY